MKKAAVLIFSFCVMLFVTACQNAQTRAGEGALLGGVLGAAAGGVIGHQSHHGGEGAAIGAAAGALTGAIVGSQMPKQGQKPQPAGQPAQEGKTVNPNQMSIQQITELARQGVHEDVIIDKIRLTNSRFQLTAEDINYLKQNGVSQKVINAMQGI